jgi:hypothetical protein
VVQEFVHLQVALLFAFYYFEQEVEIGEQLLLECLFIVEYHWQFMYIFIDKMPITIIRNTLILFENAEQ